MEWIAIDGARVVKSSDTGRVGIMTGNGEVTVIESSGGGGGGGGGGTVDAYTKAQTDKLLLKKVDKENGKGLFSGSYNDLVDTPTIPTKTSELQNDSGYLTEHQDLTNYATKTYVGEQIANAEHLKREIVTVIPSDTEAKDNIIYMLKVESATGNDKYQEYMKIDGTVQMVGDTSVDLTDYAKKTDIPTTLPANGGNADTVNNHTVETDVPTDAKFTDTVYDDTEVKGSIDELSSNLDTLEFGEVAGGKNLLDIEEKIYSNSVTDEKTSFIATLKVNNTWTGAVNVTGNGIFSITFDITDSNINNIKLYHSGLHVDITLIYKDIYLDVGKYTMSFDAIGCNPQVVNGIKIQKIQIEKGTTATEYEPYIPSVKMLSEESERINDSLSVIGKCKNLLNPTLETTTHNGITLTRNDDGTCSLSGSRTDTSTAAYMSFIIDYPLEKGMYKLTGALNENNNIRCIIKKPGSENKNIYDYGKGVVLDVSEANTTITLIIISTDDTSQTRIVKPMLTTNLNATFDDFVPYTGDGETLIHDVAELKNDLSDEWTRKTYSVGDYCIYKNSMWRCLVSNSVEPSEGSNWTRVTIGSELKRIIAMIN